MEVGSAVWIKGKETKRHANDAEWMVGSVVSKDVNEKGGMDIVVRASNGSDFMFSSNKGGLDLENLQLKNVGTTTGPDNLIDLPYLNEPEILQSLSTRYFNRKIYTYTGNVLIAINPRHAIVPDDSCESFMGTFASEVKTLAVGLTDGVAGSLYDMNGGIRRHAIIINGESGSGKTEVAKLLTMLLISAEVKSSRDYLGVKITPLLEADTSDEDSDSEGNLPRSHILSRSESRDSMMHSPGLLGRGELSPVSSVLSELNLKDNTSTVGSPKKRSGFLKAYQLSTMERIRQVTPILEAFGNACIAHTTNSSRLGKYAELSFSKRGELLRGEFRTYLLENVRVTKQLERERNFHVFYQLAAGASETDKERWAVSDISKYHFANQGGVDALSNPLVDDAAGFQALKDNFASLGFEDETVESVFQVVAGILHLGEVNFSIKTTLEGQVAVITEKFVETGFTQELEIDAAARLCSLPTEDLARSLTVRSVLLNKEVFTKSLTEPQAYHTRDALAKAMYKRLFTWLVQELNQKLRPTEELPAEIASSVGILDIFGFDCFALNTFEQLCINYANEALQQHFSLHMFKLEIEEYRREAIPFEDIEYPDNQDSLDLITNGVFSILDDQCRIPDPTDKRFASQLYKELTSFTKFSANPLMISSHQFCVHHFAGPVVYSCDKFIEKNLDELPQDAKNVLQRSGNVVLNVEVPTLPPAGPLPSSHHNSVSRSLSQDPSDKPAAPAAPVMSAYVSKIKVDPASRVPGAQAAAPARRGSAVGRGVPNSVVTQLKNEVSVMMNHINATIPHYVCCINPVERMSANSQVAEKIRNGDIQYQPHIVAAQLRYGGILSAVKIARSGLPHRYRFVEFFQRFRPLVNPLNPVAERVASHVTVRDGDQVAREQCVLLVQSLTNQSGKPVVVSIIQGQLADEMQNILRRRSIRHWMGSIGGVINDGAAAVGLTKVFLSKQAHILLESCLYHMHNLCRQKIASIVMRIIHRKRMIRTMRSINFIQRVMRGALARARTRLLKRKKAYLAALGSEDGVESPSKVDKYHITSLESEVRELKRQDAMIQEQIKNLVAQNKVSDEPDQKIRMDFPTTKQELMNFAARFPSTSVINVKTIEASDAIGEGYQLLRPEKLIPLTAVSKALSFGRNSAESRSSSVRAANKIVTKDHAMFKSLHKLMDRLRELFELSKLEKEVLDTRRRNRNKAAAAAAVQGGSGKQTPTAVDTDFGDLEVKMGTLDKIAKLTRTIYQYYHQYILEFVKEYGADSRYRNSFTDDNQYLLALTALVEEHKPLLSFEKPVDPNADPDETTVSGSTRNFPLYIPSERQQGPQHQGYLPLCTYGGVHFKVLPPSHAPGVEYSINALRRLLKGHHFMYPIKYLKIIGKSGEGKGKESFYQAATQFGAKNLSTVDRTLTGKVSLEDFSAMVIVSMVFGAKAVFPQHLMADVSNGEVVLQGVNCDEIFLTHLFQYKSSHGSEDLNVLYMMPQMDMALPPRAAALLSKAGMAARLVSAWLREMSMQNKRFTGLKSAGFVPADLATLTLPIVLPPHAAAHVQHILFKLSNAVQDATLSGRILTHSDLLASAESALAEKYAEMRILFAKSPGVSFLDYFQGLHKQHGAALKGDPRIKNTFTMDVDHLTAEVLNTLDFRLVPDSPENQAMYTALFDNFSFLPSLHLRNISESQLRLLFNKLLAWNKQAYQQQSALRSAQPRSSSSSPAPRRDDGKVYPAVRTAVKSITLCGLDSAVAKAIAGSEIVRTIQQELGIRVALESPRK